jgi:hypothetical protein
MKVKFAENRDTWRIEDILGEDKVIEFKAKLAGYTVEKITSKPTTKIK